MTRATAFPVVVLESDIDGHGVFALRAFKEDDVIGVITGTIPEEVDPFCEFSVIDEEDGVRWAIEPAYPFRYLNHANEPNAEIDGCLLRALKAIAPREEITIHYGDGWDEEEDEEDWPGTPTTKEELTNWTEAWNAVREIESDLGDFKVRYVKKNPQGEAIPPRHWVPYVAWDELKGWEHHDEFMGWMRGKTCAPEGVYPWDLARFIRIVKKRERDGNQKDGTA